MSENIINDAIDLLELSLEQQNWDVVIDAIKLLKDHNNFDDFDNFDNFVNDGSHRY
jgi:hypothetical protein